MAKNVISILVDNHAGVLTRVSSMFGRRGFNIDSLTVSATSDPDISRITVVVDADENVLEQIIKQTARLEETRDIFVLKRENSLFRELLLVKVAADDRHHRPGAGRTGVGAGGILGGGFRRARDTGMHPRPVRGFR